MTNPISKIYTGNANKALFGAAAGMFVLYSFLIVSTVVSIDQRKNANADIRATQSRVSDLEIKYFNLASSIDMTKATQMGFVDSKTPTFAYVQPQDEKVAIR